jgi:ABC-type dipeptide/oligopeptide/nickel transport system permease component
MRGINFALRVVLAMPPVWVALLAVTVAFAASGWQPVLDILRFAAWRLGLTV